MVFIERVEGIMSLIGLAISAMPDRKGSAHASPRLLALPQLCAAVARPLDLYILVQLHIQDRGCGINPQIFHFYIQSMEMNASQDRAQTLGETWFAESSYAFIIRKRAPLVQLAVEPVQLGLGGGVAPPVLPEA